jgi:acyl-CoA thioesterase-1
MPPYLAFFLDGSSFIAGNLLVIVSLGLLLFPNRWRWQKLAGRLLCLIGVVLVLASAMPLHPALYLLWGLLVVAGQGADWVSKRLSLDRTSLLLAAVVGALFFTLVDLHNWQTPRMSLPDDLPIHVVGDSLSAGIGNEKPWPARLNLSGNHPVRNAAFAGATAATAMRQAEALPEELSLVLLEIGGNDLLNGTSADEFGRDLDALLTRLRLDNRLVVMFELPLPPGCNGYGRQQRRLADKHGCLLIPRFLLAQLLSMPGCTCDGLHLSDKGHQVLADYVTRFLGSQPVTR